MNGLDTLCREEATAVEASLQAMLKVEICDSGHVFQDNSGNASVGWLFLKVFLCLTKSFQGLHSEYSEFLLKRASPYTASLFHKCSFFQLFLNKCIVLCILIG